MHKSLVLETCIRMAQETHGAGTPEPQATILCGDFNILFEAFPCMIKAAFKTIQPQQSNLWTTVPDSARVDMKHGDFAIVKGMQAESVQASIGRTHSQEHASDAHDVVIVRGSFIQQPRAACAATKEPARTWQWKAPDEVNSWGSYWKPLLPHRDVAPGASAKAAAAATADAREPRASATPAATTEEQSHAEQTSSSSVGNMPATATTSAPGWSSGPHSGHTEADAIAPSTCAPRDGASEVSGSQATPAHGALVQTSGEQKTETKRLAVTSEARLNEDSACTSRPAAPDPGDSQGGDRMQDGMQATPPGLALTYSDPSRFEAREHDRQSGNASEGGSEARDAETMLMTLSESEDDDKISLLKEVHPLQRYRA